jgi:hypothetical protein
VGRSDPQTPARVLLRGHSVLTPEEGAVINGLIVLALSLLLWKLTAAFYGWLFLFTIGSALVLWGLMRGFSRWR